ncbi:MAG: GPR endopeptidase, partial [Clostridia bacterium]|nr:GPR endopeptidase [Clostridia bacterium]
VDADTIIGEAIGQTPDYDSHGSFLVTPKDIDALAEKSAKVLGYAINLALQGDMSVADMEQFLC